MEVKNLFEAELAGRGIGFSIDPESGRHVIEMAGGRFLVSLANLARDIAVDGDAGKVARFVDAIIASEYTEADLPSIAQLYWILEPNDYAEPPAFRAPLSKRADRVLVHLSADGKLVTWATPASLKVLGLTEQAAGAAALRNLELALADATLETRDIDGMALGYLGTTLPFKTALLLAPNLQQVIGATLGWPLLAVAPDRDFLYLWAACHTGLAGQLGGVVVREHAAAPYPVSTEIFELSDQGVRAIGAYSAA